MRGAQIPISFLLYAGPGLPQAPFQKKQFPHTKVSSKTKGPGEEGAPTNHPEMSSRKLGDFECRYPYDSYRRDRAPFWPFLGAGFWGNIRRPLVLPAPLFYCYPICPFPRISLCSRNHCFVCRGQKTMKMGEAFYLQLELSCLQLSFFAYSPLRRLLDALSHCKQKSSKCK